MQRSRLSASAMAAMMTVALTAAPSAAGQLSILWDDSHDADGDELGGNYSAFATAVTAAGHLLFEHNDADGLLTLPVLTAHDVFMVFDAEEPFDPTEVTALQDFVTQGGILFITGEAPNPGFNTASHNTLLLPYDVQFTGGLIGSTFDLTVFAGDHPLTIGLGPVDFLIGGELSASGDGTKVLGATAFGQVGFAYGAGGLVVVLTDSNPLDNFGLVDPPGTEARLLANLLAHFEAMAMGGGAEPIEITIDIKPGGEPNAINPKSGGVVAVAILTTSVVDGDEIDFDPWDSLDVETLRFGPGEAPLAHAQGVAEDVDGDGDLDMVTHFEVQAIGVSCGDTELTLVAETYEGENATGTDSIVTPGCP